MHLMNVLLRSASFQIRQEECVINIQKVWAVYFSPTGTTQKIVTEIAKAIRGGISVESYDFDFTLPDARKGMLTFSSDDLVILGTPVYAGRVPNVLLKYLKTIQGNGAIGVPVVVYGNRNYDDALVELRDIMQGNGFHTVAAGAFIGEHSFSKTLAKDRPDGADIAIARSFAAKIIEKLKLDDNFVFSPLHVKGVSYPYRGYYQPEDRKGNPVDIRKVKPLTNADCNDCKICADVCPMGSINRENINEVAGICIKCGACIKKCPINAKYYDDAAYLYHQRELEEELIGRAEPELFL